MEETVTESNPSKQMNDLGTDYKVATEKFLSEFKELFAKQAEADKVIRLEFAIMLLILWVKIAVNFFD